MTEEEKMVFWGDLVEPITALLGGLLVREEYKLVDVVMDIVSKAESAVLEEREACAKVCENISGYDRYEPETTIAAAIRARGQNE